ncbi:MAG: LCP family protein [Spirochaetota bacterium]
MRGVSFDKSSLPLLAILILALALGTYLVIRLSTNSVDEAIKGDRILNIMIILEEGGVPVASELFFFYPTTGKGAVLDVPGETGLILKTVNKVDRIDAVYSKGNPRAYLNEIAHMLDTEIPYWIVLDETGLRTTTDFLEGLEMFLPTAVDQKGPPAVLLPSGAVVLDGDKVLQYAVWKPADEDDAAASTRRQRLFQSILRRIGEKSDWLSRQEVFPSWRGSLRSNLGIEGLKRFIHELSGLDTDHLVLQRINGTRRAVDGKVLLFPHYDGDLVRDIVKQTLNALASSSAAIADKIYTLEVLNGTALKGLANRTAEIFQSFGYNVVGVGNADREDYASTRVLYRNNVATEAANNVATVIQCKNILSDSGGVSKSDADFTIILGSDFNGRYVIGH